MWQKYLMLAVCGGAGTLTRYLLSGAAQRWLGSSFPWGTLVVNAAGCLLFGIVAGLLEDRVGIAPQLRIYALVGFLGALTTFSTYSFETAELMLDRQWLSLAINVLTQNAVGIVLVVAGLALGRQI